MQGDASVDGFLRSLGLEKYLITFQAEEVSNAPKMAIIYQFQVILHQGGSFFLG